MKITNDQWNRIIQAAVTFIVTICNIVLMTSCTIALSVSKHNQNSHQAVEQTTRLDSINQVNNLNK